MYKEYLVKVYDKDNNFKKTLLNSELVDGWVVFLRSIGLWYWPVSITYNIKHKDLDIDVFDVVYVYYGYDLIYRWFVESYRKIFKEWWEYVNINLQGMQAILKYIVYESSSQIKFTKNTDPATIIDEILTNVNTKRGWTVFNTWVTSYWSNVNIEFDKDSCLSAIRKVMDNLEHFIDYLPNGDVVFSAIDNATIDHKLTFGKHISEFVREIDSINMINDIAVYFWSGAWVETYDDTTSQNKYWVLESVIDVPSIKNATTALLRAESEILDKKNPKQKTQLTVNSSYNIESLNIWDTISINNKEDETSLLQLTWGELSDLWRTWASTETWETNEYVWWWTTTRNIGHIARIEYRWSLAIVSLDDFDSIWKALLSLS